MKIKIIIFVIIGLFPIYPILFINYLVDPYGIFQSNFLNQPGSVQERFYKINYIKKNFFNEIIIGSSRVGPINTSKINSKLNKNIYNFYISSGNMAEFEYIIKWIPSGAPHIKTIYLQIDWPENYGLAGDQLPYQLHPEVSKKNKIDFFKQYLFSLQFDAIMHKLKKNYSDNYSDYKFDYVNGSFSYPRRDFLIYNNCDEYQNQTGYFKNVNIKNNKSARQDSINRETINSIMRINKFAIDNNLKVIFYTAPHNKNFIDSINIEEYITFINDLTKVTSFHNFLFYNDLTINNCNYYESSHYTDAISMDLFNALAINDNISYSHYTTTQNLKDEIMFLKSNFKKNRAQE
jgi:hypothetical protein